MGFLQNYLVGGGGQCACPNSTNEMVLCLFKSKEGSDSEYEQDQERLEEIEGFLSQHDLEFNRLVYI